MGLPISNWRSYRFPLRRGPRGYFDVASDLDVVRQAIEQVLGTQPGERVMRPTFGCDFESLLFEPNDEVLHVRTSHLVIDALSRWVPAIKVDGVDTDVSSNPASENEKHLAEYTVRFHLKSTGQASTVDGTFDVRR